MNGFVTTLRGKFSFAQVAFLEHAFALLWLAPFCLRWRSHILPRAQLKLHALRVLSAVCGVLFFYQALGKLPMATVVALGFLGPIFTTLGAVFFLNEVLTWSRVAAVGLGILGALFIKKTFFSPFWNVNDVWLLFPVLSSLAFSISNLTNKKLTFKVSPLVLAHVLIFWMTPFFGLLALPTFVMPQVSELFLFSVLGFLTVLAHYSLSASLKLTDITFLLPIGSLRFIFTALIGFVFFAQVPGFSVYLGFFVIFMALCVLGFFEKKHKRSSVP